MDAKIPGLLSALLFLCPPLLAETPSRCTDTLPAKFQIHPQLDSPFFHTLKTSLPWTIIRHDDGSLEDSSDGSIDPDDLVQIEHSSSCISTHQGRHEMDFCDAIALPKGMALTIHGGMPAYASNLRIFIADDKTFACNFSAVYPNSRENLRWKILSKKLLLKSWPVLPGERLHGRISVEFEESTEKGYPVKKYKIEGFLKPVVCSMQPAPR